MATTARRIRPHDTFSRVHTAFGSAATVSITPISPFARTMASANGRIQPHDQRFSVLSDRLLERRSTDSCGGLVGWLGLTHEDVEVLDGSGAAQIEEVRALADGAGVPSLPLTYGCQGMLHGSALAQFGASSRGRLALAPFLEQAFVWVDRDATAVGAAGAALGSRQAAQVAAGNCTAAPDWQGMVTSLGQRMVPASPSSVKAVLGS